MWISLLRLMWQGLPGGLSFRNVTPGGLGVTYDGPEWTDCGLDVTHSGRYPQGDLHFWCHLL